MPLVPAEAAMHQHLAHPSVQPCAASKRSLPHLVSLSLASARLCSSAAAQLPGSGATCPLAVVLAKPRCVQLQRPLQAAYSAWAATAAPLGQPGSLIASG